MRWWTWPHRPARSQAPTHVDLTARQRPLAAASCGCYKVVMREFRLLGPVEVVSGRETLVLGGQKQRALLGMLLLEAGRVVSTDRLLDGLWGERPPRTAPTALQNLVSQLR